MDEIRVTIRTATTGHQTVALPLDELPAFIDHQRREGRLAIATSGDASVIVRIGKEILDFFRGRRHQADETGRPREDEEVTVLNPLAGGRDGAPETTPGLIADVLAVAASGRAGPRGGLAPEAPRGYAQTASERRRGSPLDGEAEMRAWRGLVDREGEAAAMTLLHGGGLAVRSYQWPVVVYLVKTDIVLVLRDGQIVQRLCLQSADGAPLWDTVANRLQLLRAGPEGELLVWATAGIL